jgi:hypothetical protein
MSFSKTRLIATILTFFVGVAAHAQTQTLINIEGSPAAWRLQDYPGMTPAVTVWFTGSSCSNGNLSFPPSASIDDQNRFWALIMAAKLAGQTVGVYYYVSGSACFLNSYYFPP